MNYLQEHFENKYKDNIYQNKVLFCYHDNMVEVQEICNLSADSFKNITDLNKDVRDKIMTEETRENWRGEPVVFTTHKYNNGFVNWDSKDGKYNSDLIVVGIDDFKKDYPYFPLDKILSEISSSYYYTRRNEDFIIAQIICLALKYPQLELLYKTNFKKLAIDWVKEPSKTEYSRCFKSGKNLDEITKLPKYAWSSIINYAKDINEYNELRIWVQKDGLSKEALEEIISQRLGKKELSAVRKLCTKTFNGKKLYTLETLLNYLHRCDVYQAIPQDVAIELLDAYIRMSIDLGVEPLTNSNSLKREHDVTARNHLQWWQKKRNTEYEKGFAEQSSKLQKFEFEDENYIAITPRTIDDLLNEASQQRNCLSCYTSYYAQGHAKIFFVRKKNEKEKSYISIEMDNDLTRFIQKFYSCNRPVDNPQDLAFLDKWLEHIQKVKVAE